MACRWARSTRSNRCPTAQAAIHLAMDPSQLHLIPSQRARRHRVVDGVRRQVRRAGAPAEPLAAAAARRPGDSEPARHGRDQHGLPATGVGAGQDRPGEAQRDPRRDRDGVQRPRREDRQDADRLRRVPGQDRTEPARISATTSRSLLPTFNAYADAAPDLVDDRRATRHRSAIPSSTSSRTSTSSWSARSVWPTSATTWSAATAKR